MPSKDSYHKKHPETNAWMHEESSGLKDATSVGSSLASAKGPVRAVSATVMRLARRLEKDPDELAKKIPADTLRRTKYPVIEIENADGTRTYKHDPGIHEGPISAR